jgi:hypothetical protein
MAIQALQDLWQLSRRLEGMMELGLQIFWRGIVGWWAMGRDRELGEESKLTVQAISIEDTTAPREGEAVFI